MACDVAGTSSVLRSVSFELDSCFDAETADLLRTQLVSCGAAPALDGSTPTHLITRFGTASPDHPASVQVVTDVWVQQCVKCRFRLEERFYRPDRNLWLSGKVVCLADVGLPSRACLTYADG